jgi:transcriptional regulator with XRE-family HTH domain
MDRERAKLAQKAFGARVRQFRKAVKPKLSQEALGFACGLDRSYIGRIERGESNVGLVNIHRIAEALKVDVAEFFLNG